MVNQGKVSGWVIALSVAMSGSAIAQGNGGNSSTNQGTTPNGKPFTAIQQQFSQVDQQLQALIEQVQALQTQVDTVEGNLQAQIDEINLTLADHQGQLGDLTTASASLVARVTANESVIVALDGAVADLQSQLAAAQVLLTSHTGDITQLAAQVTTIQALINSHNSQIGALEDQQQLMNQFIANLANGSCQAGQAIAGITAGGAIVCTQASSGTLQTYFRQAATVAAFGNNSLSVSCDAGDVATGSGYYVPTWLTAVTDQATSFNYRNNTQHKTAYFWDYTYWGSYQNSVSFWDNDFYLVPHHYTRFIGYAHASMVYSTYALQPGGYVSFQFAPPNFSNGYTYSVFVNCLRLQP